MQVEMRRWKFRASGRSPAAIGPALNRVAGLVGVIGLAFLSGCGSVYSLVTVTSAESRVEQARVLGAETAAPFEYYYAVEHLRQARIESSEASYGDAASYAETAETYAQKAIDSITASRKSGTK